ncbi:hypothetical protein [Oceanospirillum linum]|uniref:MotA/TolQ/ExbB proton channel domain-containing protein n=1 Tax=Oceanospirillum linum TaxID=966 RepID=A0A1T1HB80_OCELI|nr:hypothetical protein [Oceanospirillum linum]OOV86987.1 hypothetical protein BTA35_0208175 [Oceanospirillum linum]SEF70693.1 hypothetical protein SAMN04489856_10232 [Oleiphilus messinensis]SMP15403.1 hypothetical protein SAMN06264348_10330 [Oceanospirillum linum]
MDFLAAFSPLTSVVILIIMALTLYFHGPVYSLRTVNAAPSILTSIGIFGTFLGVALGLMDFDTTDIEGSVPQLIEGLKTAFWSSIAGLLAAMSIKLRHVIKHVRNYETETKYTGATVDDLATLLGDIRLVLNKSGLADIGDNIQAGTKGLEQHLGRLETVISQYQEEMVSANSNALTSAITELMTSFNDKITVQYGDNFRQLNQAVGRMVEWQENYKGELAKLLEQQKANGDVLDKATEAYQTMVQHTQAFNEVSEKLGDVMTGLQQQSNSLGSYLDSLASLVSKASDGLPALEGRIMALTEELAGGIRESHKQMNDLLTQTSATIEKTVITVNRQLVTDMEQVNSRHHDVMLQMLDRNEKQLVRMDNAMEQELTHALQTFGGQLTALSEKFVSDYLPLTEKLRQVVQISAQLPGEGRPLAGAAKGSAAGSSRPVPATAEPQAAKSDSAKVDNTEADKIRTDSMKVDNTRAHGADSAVLAPVPPAAKTQEAGGDHVPLRPGRRAARAGRNVK